MRTLALGLAIVLWAGFSASPGSAFSYLRTDGTIVDPVLRGDGFAHACACPDLEPGVTVTGDLEFVVLVEADLRGATIDSYMVNANFQDADLSGASLFGNVSYANFGGVDLSGAQVDVSGVDAGFHDADLTQARVLVAASVRLIRVDLTGADLSGADLRFSTFGGANVAGADFRGARLSGAYGMTGMVGAALYDRDTDFSNAWVDGGWMDAGSVPFDPVAAGWTLVPEPSTALLLGLGLCGLAGSASSRRNAAAGRFGASGVLPIQR